MHWKSLNVSVFNSMLGAERSELKWKTFYILPASVPLRIVFGKQVQANKIECIVGYVNNTDWVQTNGFDRLGLGGRGAQSSINNW